MRHERPDKAQESKVPSNSRDSKAEGDTVPSPEPEAAKPGARSTGAGYPTMSLVETSAALKKIGEYGQVHTLSSLAGHLGHTTTNSGPFRQKLAALREWGVISGKGDELTLTQIGAAIAFPVGDDSVAMREAFFNAKVFAAVYAAVVKNRPLDVELIANTAVRNHRVAAKSKDEFVRSFVASAVAAGLAERPDATHVTLYPKPAEAGDRQGDAPEGGPNHGETTRSGSGPSSPGPQPVLRQVWQAGPAQVVLEIRSTRALAAGDFQRLGKVIAEIEQMVEAMTPVVAGDAAD